MRKRLKDMSLELSAYLNSFIICNPTEKDERELLERYFQVDVKHIKGHRYQAGDYYVKLVYTELLWSGDLWFNKALVDYKI